MPAVQDTLQKLGTQMFTNHSKLANGQTPITANVKEIVVLVVVATKSCVKSDAQVTSLEIQFENEKQSGVVYRLW